MIRRPIGCVCVYIRKKFNLIFCGAQYGMARRHSGAPVLYRRVCIHQKKISELISERVISSASSRVLPDSWQISPRLFPPVLRPFRLPSSPSPHPRQTSYRTACARFHTSRGYGGAEICSGILCPRISRITRIRIGRAFERLEHLRQSVKIRANPWTNSCNSWLNKEIWSDDFCVSSVGRVAPSTAAIARQRNSLCRNCGDLIEVALPINIIIRRQGAND